MSISTTTRKAGPFVGNDVQTVFPFAFKVFAAADMVVTRVLSATGVETLLVLATDYSVTLNPDQEAAPGGSITLVVPLASTQKLALTSNVAALQSVVITNGGGFFPAVFNGVFDKLTILVQQALEQLSRSLKVGVTSTITDLTIPVSPSTVLQWNASGTALVAQTLPDLSLSLALPPMAGKGGYFLTNDGASIASWTNLFPVFAPFGGASAAFPALKRSGTQLQVRLGDDSAFANLGVNRLAFGTATVGNPMLTGNGAALEVRLGDDSALARVNTAGVSLNGQEAATQNFAIAMAVAFGG
ncbi:hypothetical protein UFOVP1324_60 [uncultured Caudovirales phage]|uniref:Uncharacterized protein n=1 Tax=uncultured Caudovirales phage TaxID=2100421 RepID=A0A6J5RN95_9CAUD|nr:hypothetical protein UFOVP1324_60 [uncultured Caudovirales phage]